MWLTFFRIFNVPCRANSNRICISYPLSRYIVNMSCDSEVKDAKVLNADSGSQQAGFIKEGQTEIAIPSSKNVFYNPVQEFNRDLSVAVLTLFAEDNFKKNCENHQCQNEVDGEAHADYILKQPKEGTKYEDGLVILEALSATGLRSIRYAKEIPGIKQIVANDISQTAVNSIQENIVHNGVQDLVTTSHDDAVMVMYRHRQPALRFHAIDLDPYGCPSVFLDAAVQSVSDGGLLLVTCTDMAVLAGNSPETCYTKYGAVSLRTKSCHEMGSVNGSEKLPHDNLHLDYEHNRVKLTSVVHICLEIAQLWVRKKFLASNENEIKIFQKVNRLPYSYSLALRITLKCIESHANRYGRYIVPLLSLSADFYVRVFVRIHTSPITCKQTTSKLSYVYRCVGCDTTYLQPLGVCNKVKDKPKQLKFSLPHGPPVGTLCENCGQKFQMGGPIWSGPLHDPAFVSRLEQLAATGNFGTSRRMQGMLAVIQEELNDVPLYYMLDKLCATIRSETMSMLQFRSALMNAGYRVSLSHANRSSIKTDAPPHVVWDIMRVWEREHPVKRDRLSDAGRTILSKEPVTKVSFEIHPEANPESRQRGLVRFQENPKPFWGPGTRAKINFDTENKMEKSKKNQGKRSRSDSRSPGSAGSKKILSDACVTEET